VGRRHTSQVDFLLEEQRGCKLHSLGERPTKKQKMQPWACLRKKIAANLEPSLDLSGIDIGDLVGWWVVGSVDGAGLSVDSGE